MRHKTCDVSGGLAAGSREIQNYIFEKGYDKKYGARPLKRAIQTNVEDLLAEEILQGKIKRGDRVGIVVEEQKVKFKVK